MNSPSFRSARRAALLGALLMLAATAAKAQMVNTDAPSTDDITYFWMDFAMGTPGTVFNQTSTKTVEIFSTGMSMSYDWTTGQYEYGEHVGEVRHLSAPWVIQQPWGGIGIRG